jgi:hypothetical protein
VRPQLSLPDTSGLPGPGVDVPWTPDAGMVLFLTCSAIPEPSLVQGPQSCPGT